MQVICFAADSGLSGYRQNLQNPVREGLPTMLPAALQWSAKPVKARPLERKDETTPPRM